MNLAFAGSASEAVRYGSITNRIEGANWSAFVPMDGADAAKGKEALGASVVEDSIDALVEGHSKELDAFVIHSASESLQEAAKSAGKAGISFLSGPLLASSLGALAALTSEMNGSALVPAFTWRFIPAIQSLKASLDAGKLGEIGLIRLHRWHSEASDMADRIIPAIDIATWFFGHRPTKIFSLQGTSGKDYIQVHLQFEGDGMVVIDDTADLPDGGDYFSLTVIGGTGAAYADDHRNMNLVVDGVHPHAIRTGQGEAHLIGQLKAFVNHVRGEAAETLTTQDAADVLDVSDTVLERVGSVAVWKDGSYEFE